MAYLGCVSEQFRPHRRVAIPYPTRWAERLFAPGLECAGRQGDTAIPTCFDDSSSMRRHLVEEGRLTREKDGSAYRTTTR